MDLTSLTLTEAYNLIQDRQISPVELTRAFLERIEQINPQLNCFITLTPDIAIQQAQRAEKILAHQSEDNPRLSQNLIGIPLTLKDLYETHGIRTTAGSAHFKDFIPETDAVAVTRLTRAGAVLLGKTNLHEIALGVTNVNPHFGTARNPWDRTRITGGSSGGSAAAVASGLCLGSLGTDSGGSIRIPAALCGIVGLKPTYGRVSLRGVIPLSWNTDHAGPLAKRVADAAVLLQVIAGYDRKDPYSIKHPRGDFLSRLTSGIKDWRIVLAVDDYFYPTDREVWEAVQAAALVFRALGARVEQRPFPGMLPAAQANLLMVTSDAAAYHKERLENHPEGFGEDILRRLRSGAAHTSTEYIQARRTQTLQRRQFEQFFKDVDILLLPTTPVAAPMIEGPDAVEQARLLTRNTAPFNLTGLPALSLPCGFTSLNLPIGLQMIAPPWAEASLLRAAQAYEQATEWHLRKPVLEKAW